VTCAATVLRDPASSPVSGAFGWLDVSAINVRDASEIERIIAAFARGPKTLTISKSRASAPSAFAS